MIPNLEEAVLAKAEILRRRLLEKVEANLSGDAVAVRSGLLKDSIISDVAGTAGGASVSVGSVGVPYAAILEHGGTTGPHDIVPVKAQALVFAGVGGVRFARRVHHPGSHIAARSYLSGALASLEDEIVGQFKEGVLAALGASNISGDQS